MIFFNVTGASVQEIVCLAHGWSLGMKEVWKHVQLHSVYTSVKTHCRVHDIRKSLQVPGNVQMLICSILLLTIGDRTSPTPSSVAAYF